MDYNVRIIDVSKQFVAAARERTTRNRVAYDIGRLLDRPWALIKERGDLRSEGHNVALYWEWKPEGAVEVGVQILKAFDATEAVVCSATPAGRVATTTHVGPYSELRRAHEAVRTWCATYGHRLEGPAWEVYGDWSDDPEKLRTDVHWLLA